MNFSSDDKRTTLFTATLLFLLITTTFVLSVAGDGYAATNAGGEIFFPIVRSGYRSAPIPELVTSVRLEGSRCPSDLAFDRFSKALYIVNEESDDVTVIRDKAFAGNIPTGNWPVNIASDPNSNKVYLTHVLDGIRVLQNGIITANIRPYGESYTILINPVNGYTYITDLHSPITIIRGLNKVMDLFVPDFQGNQIGWQLASAYDDATGLSYFASWQHRALTVVDGTEVVDQFSYEGVGAIDMVIDSQRRLLIVTNDLADYDELLGNNISIINLDNQQVTPVFSARASYHADLDPVTGYVYVTNPSEDTVTVLQGEREVATYETDEAPREVAVDALRGYAYVTNAGDNSVTVLKDGEIVSVIDLPRDKGFEPYNLTIDEETGTVYILNRSSVNKGTDSDRSTEVVQCKQPWLHILE